MDKERLFRYLNQKYYSKCEIANNLPLGMNIDEMWDVVLEDRLKKAIKLPLKNADGDYYWYVLTNKMISASEAIVEELMDNSIEQDIHINSVSTIEEIFFTSYMEGSQISIKEAMTFLQSGQEAQDIEELMLLNNCQAGNFAAQNIYHPINEDYLHTLAYILTNGIDNGGGEYRTEDNIEIPSMHGEEYTVPCSSDISGLVSEFVKFIAAPNIHPLIKSAVSQAWILAVRPFPEGNERLARLISNIILIRAGYTFFGNISLSSIIARKGYSYFNAVANVIRTENAADMTYFIEYYLTLLSTAVTELRTRRTQKEQETYEAEKQMAQVPLSQPTEKPLQISAEEKAIPKTNKYADKVKVTIQKFHKKGITEFLAKDIANETDITPKQAYKALVFLEGEGYISCIRRKSSGNIYTSISEKRETIDKQSIIEGLQEKTHSKKESTSKIASLLLDYLKINKQSFTVSEVADEVKIDILVVRNVMIMFKKFNYIKTTTNKGKYCYSFNFGIDETTAETETVPAVNDYSKETLNLLQELKSSVRSAKDRRIGEILTECLPKGIVTESDYIRHNEKSKWTSDMKFAVLLGLVENNGKNEYRILPQIADSRFALMEAQKSTLSALYEFFGDDIFSVEMAVAKLEYSTSHLSGMLHQFTRMKLIDSQMNADNTLSYHLNVNPKDHPECFAAA